MSENFTVHDLVATSIAFTIFFALLVAPGYVLGALLQTFSFDKRSVLAKLAISIGLSIAVVPIGVYLNWLALPAAPWLLCAASWLAVPFVLARERRRRTSRNGPLTKQRSAVLIILAGWLVVATLCLIDIQIGHRLYFPIVAFDYSARTAITAAVMRGGIPPPNPFFYSGHSYVLHYHYFWYMLCGLVARFGGPFVTPRIAVLAGTLWSGIGLVALVTVYAHFFHGGKPGNQDKRMLAAVALLSITGLDILALAVNYLISGRFNASSEWWNEVVLSWVNSVFWQPHSVAALVACATGFLVVWDASKNPSVRVRVSGALLGGAAFASGLGLSVYIALIFAVFLLVWAIWLLFSRRGSDVAAVCLTSLAAVILSTPYLIELVRSGAGAAPPIGFAIRSFYLAEGLLGNRQDWRTPLANAVSLPLNYFLEFGFFFMVGVTQWKRLRHFKKLNDEHACGIAMLSASILVCSFLRSNSIQSNDLGWRGILVAQFVLLLWAAELWDNALFPSGKTRFTLLGWTLALGALPAIYDVTMLRIYPILLDDLSIPRYHWLAPDHLLGERTYALRQVYETMARDLPRRALVQQNPDGLPGDLFYGLYADRQTVAETAGCGVVFGGEAAPCPAILAQLHELFGSASTLDSHQVDSTCRKLSITALIVKDTDGVWRNQHSWVWTRTPFTANNYSRAFLCGDADKQ